jgi:TonB family protein
MRLILLVCAAALGACAPGGRRSNTASPAGCDRVNAHPVQQREGAKEDADLSGPAEEAPCLLNVRHVERRLADTVRSLPIDTVPRPVVMRYRVSAEGRVEGAVVVQTSGSGDFDQAVVWSMGFAQFRPARINGRPVAVWVEQDFTPHFPPRRRRRPAREPGVQSPPPL